MKILLLHQYFLEEDDAGGSRWNEISKSWTDAGHEVTVIAGMMHANGSSKRDEYKGKYFVRKNQGKVNVHRVHVSESYNSGFLGRLWGYFSFMFSSFWAGVFKIKGKYDVIIVTSPPLFVGGSGYFISLFKRIPMVFEIRDLWPESAIDTGVLTNKLIIKLAYGFENFIYKKAKLINVLTPAFYNTLIEKKNVNKNKLIMIPNASDFSLSEEVRQNFDRDKFREEHDFGDHFVITYVGAHGVANHLEQILEAGKALEDTKVLFLLIGQGMRKESLKSLAAEMGVVNVRFIDPVAKKDVFKYIIASDMGISVLKRVDTFKTVYSNKTFDYFSCKTPVLMGIDGISKELVEEAKAGSYIEPENISEYNRIIRGYINDPERIRTEGENGYLYAKLNFDRQVLSDRYLESIKQII
ncbi:glycosyl transferase family 1 [Flavobacterium psychrophilum]|nr:glycosyl transferase family 1 [Flavobacterium psychrophilum]AOE53521.1 glycosyl transferase family 1 [Flavobacterium psychrophilum]